MTNKKREMHVDEEKLTYVDLSTDFNASWARVAELQKGRNLSDIPLKDEYWKAIKKHQAAFGNRNG